jgi:hypothetical protein
MVMHGISTPVKTIRTGFGGKMTTLEGKKSRKKGPPQASKTSFVTGTFYPAQWRSPDSRREIWLGTREVDSANPG